MNVAMRGTSPIEPKHCALSDARLVKDVFLELLRRIGTVPKIADLAGLLPPLTSADAPVCAFDPQIGFEALAAALSERCAMLTVYAHGWQRPTPRMITPGLLLEIHSVAYVIVPCHLSDTEKTFRLDRFQECWLD
jgi:hypothetical protein